MRDAGGELTERGQLLRLHKAVLRVAQVFQRLRQFARAGLDLSNSRTFSIAMTAWSANVVTNSICLSVNGRGSRRCSVNTPTIAPSLISGTPSPLRMFATTA